MILGSASSWNLQTNWDYWKTKGTELLREHGVAVFDFSSQIQSLIKDEGIHLKRDEGAMDAFALCTSNVFDYLTASVPVDHPSFTNRVDVEIDEKWAPFYEQTQLEFPTLKVKAPPPPRGKAASATTGG